jgi:hypothetical protein
MECQYCHKNYRSVSSLNHHKKTNKTCLASRQKNENRIVELEEVLRQKDILLNEKDQTIKQKDEIIEKKDKTILDLAMKTTTSIMGPGRVIKNDDGISKNHFLVHLQKNGRI